MIRDFIKYEKGIAEGTKIALPEGYHELTEVESLVLHQVICDIRHKISTILDDNGINMDYLE
jgi:hypothetical protein